MKAYKVFLFILTCILILGVAGLYFPQKGVKLAGIELKFLHPYELIRKDTSETLSIDTILRRAAVEKLNELRSLEDSFIVYMNFATESPARLHFPDSNLRFFESLYENFESAEREKRVLRILHYGDSQIEMDRISAQFRQGLQEIFGGKGVGMIPAVQTIPSSSLSQWYSGNLTHYAVHSWDSSRVSHRRYGPACRMGQLYGKAKIGFRKGYAAMPAAASCNMFRLILGNNHPGFSAELFNNEISLGKKTIEDSIPGLSILQWDIPGEMSRGKIIMEGMAEIYGLTLDGGYGVAVDNIAMRGSSGQVFTANNAELMSQACKELDVALIILQFGGNVMPGMNTASKALWYGDEMAKQIKHLQKICPEAKILFIGPSDMSRNIDGNMMTWPYLVEVRDALKNAALENGAAFWDMFETMGGVNSMPVWVNAKPQLAAPDYIHFTPRGAQKISELLLNAFIIDYNLYLLRKEAARIARKTNIAS